MQCLVEPDVLLLFGDAQSTWQQLCQRHTNHCGHRCRVCQCSGACDHLLAKQGEPAAAEEPIGACAVHRSIGKHSNEQRTDETANKVYSNDMEAVVEAELELEAHGKEARCACDKPEIERRQP